jgi:hypothetical protein
MRRGQNKPVRYEERHKSNCLGETVIGTREYLIRYYASKGYEAERSGDKVAAQIYFNYEEH